MKRVFFLLLLGFCCPPLLAQEDCAPDPEPVPRIFYIQRTGNTDTIVYDANLGPDGQFHQDRPIIIYWRRADQHGQRQELNYLQRTKAYGEKYSASGQANEYVFHLIAYPQRSFRLTKDDCGQPVARLTLAGKEAYLKKIFIALEPALFGLKPTVHYVEIFGVDVQTGEPAYEKFKP